MNKDEVVAMIKQRRQREFINDHLLAGVPYVFRSSEASYRTFQDTLSLQLRTPLADVSIIGSARIGFSLDPDKFGAPFSASSDIDTVLVNENMFDIAWLELVHVTKRRRPGLDARVLKAFNEHRNNNVFFGYIEPSRLPGLLGIANHWFRTFQSLSKIRDISGRSISGRLYRTWEHVRAHQLYSLECIADTLKSNG